MTKFTINNVVYEIIGTSLNVNVVGGTPSGCCHHRDPGGNLTAGSSNGPRIGPPRSVPKQFAELRLVDHQLPNKFHPAM